MSKRLPRVLVTLLVLLMPIAATAADPVEGRWVTAPEPGSGDVTILRLFIEGDRMHGEIEAVFDANNAPKHPICERCPGELRGKPLVGMRFLRDLRREGTRWIEGRVMDLRPGLTQGVVAQCELTPSGQQLVIEAWKGLRALGTSRTWERVAD